MSHPICQTCVFPTATCRRESLPAFGRSQGAVRESGRHFSVNCKTVSLQVDASLRAGIQLWTGTAGTGGWCMRFLLCETMVSEN